MPKLNTSGFAQIFLLLFLVVGLIIALVVIKAPTNLFPKAYQPDTNKESSNTLNDEDYVNWISQMQALGIYPAKDENGDILLYNRQQFVEKYCGSHTIPGTNIVSTGCYLKPASFAELSNSIQSDGEFIKALGDKLFDNGYAPLAVLKTYFPEIVNTDAVFGYLLAREPICRQEPDGTESCLFGGKAILKQISEEDLTKYINQVAAERGLTEKDPLQIAINLSDPIFGTRSIINVLTLPPNKVSDEDRINAMLGITMIYGMSEKIGVKGFELTADAIIDLGKLAENIKPIRQEILAGDVARLDGFGDMFSGIITRVKPPAKSYTVYIRPSEWGDTSKFLPKTEIAAPKAAYQIARVGEIPEPLLGPARIEFENIVRPALQAGEGGRITADVMRPVRSNVIKAITAFNERTGRNLPINRRMLDTVIDNGTSYVIADKYPNEKIGGKVVGDMMIITEGRYLSQRGIGSIHHEAVHLLGSQNPLKGWRYGGSTPKDKILTALNELGTDAWADLAMGNEIMSEGSHLATGSYAKNNPEIMDALFNRLFQNNPEFLDDVLEFTITQDADKLIAKLTGGDETEFLKLFQKKGISLNGIAYAPLTTAPLAATVNENSEETTREDPIIEVSPDVLIDPEAQN